MLFGLPLLSLVIWLPIFAGIGVLATGGDRNAPLASWLALVGSVAGFLVAIPLYTRFDPLMNAMQFVEYSPWIERFNIHYHLGIDGVRHAADFAQLLYYAAGGNRRVAGDKQARIAIYGRIPYHVGNRQWRVLVARRDSVLRFLGSHRLFRCFSLSASGAAPIVCMRRSSFFSTRCWVPC